MIQLIIPLWISAWFWQRELSDATTCEEINKIALEGYQNSSETPEPIFNKTYVNFYRKLKIANLQEWIK